MKKTIEEKLKASDYFEYSEGRCYVPPHEHYYATEKLFQIAQNEVNWPTNPLNIKTIRSILGKDFGWVFAADSPSPMGAEHEVLTTVLGDFARFRDNCDEPLAKFRAELEKQYVEWKLAANKTAAKKMAREVIADIVNLVAQKTDVPSPYRSALKHDSKNASRLEK